MDCRQFQDLAGDAARSLARGGAADAELLAHAGECEACAARLAAEQSLAQGFEILRQQDDSLGAPVGQEAVLLQQFRELHRPAPRALPHARTLYRRWLLPAAVAAMAAMAVWLASSRQELSLPRGTVTLDIPPNAPAADLPREPLRSPGPGPSASPEHFTLQPDEESSAHSMASGTPEPSEAVRERRPPDPAAESGGAVRAEVERGIEPGAEPGGASREAAPEPLTVVSAVARQEVVTDFMPLTYSGWTAGTPDARLVRVRLPSTALLYFGLPASSATEAVEADVLLGGDGLARAVRFVRPLLAVADPPVPKSPGPRQSH